MKMGEHMSSCLDIVCGVPQGSVLGPILFIVYINDIGKTSKNLQFVLFADDTNIFCTGEDLQQLLELITTEMSKLKKWFDNNKLSLNLSKTKIMLFGNCNLNNDVNVKIDGVDIERVYVYKFLGVTIDHKLSWKPQIKHVKSKLSRSISVLGKAKHILDHNSLHILYCSMILPYLNYCVEVWGTTYKSSLLPLVTLQKRAIRIINKAGYYDHTNLLFLHSRIMKFNDLVEYQVAQIMFKARNKLLPGNIQKLFFDREGGYNLREQLNFKTLAVRMTLKCHCISIGGVKLWNGMSKELKQCPNMIQFKKRFKAMIFKRYREEGQK